LEYDYAYLLWLSTSKSTSTKNRDFKTLRLSRVVAFAEKSHEKLNLYPLKDGKDYHKVKESKTKPGLKQDFARYDWVFTILGCGADPWPKETLVRFYRVV